MVSVNTCEKALGRSQAHKITKYYCAGKLLRNKFSIPQKYLYFWREIKVHMRLRSLFFMILCASALIFSSCGSSKKAVLSKPGSSASARPGTVGAFVVPDDADDATRSLLDEARRWLGVKYAYGGHSKAGTDCSGMVMEVFQSAAGLKLPRSSREQYSYCKNIDRKELKPGDLVFFANNLRTGRIGHVGLYVGGGRMIHASTSRGVIVSGLGEEYWSRHYAGSGRVEAFDKMRRSSSRKKKKKSSAQPQVHPAPPAPPSVCVDATEEADTVPVTTPQWFDRLPSADGGCGR